MKCPVCKTECGGYDNCPICGFDQLNKIFINKEEAILWEMESVAPYRDEIYTKGVGYEVISKATDVAGEYEGFCTGEQGFTLTFKHQTNKKGKVYFGGLEYNFIIKDAYARVAKWDESFYKKGPFLFVPSVGNSFFPNKETFELEYKTNNGLFHHIYHEDGSVDLIKMGAYGKNYKGKYRRFGNLLRIDFCHWKNEIEIHLFVITGNMISTGHTVIEMGQFDRIVKPIVQAKI